MSKISFNKIWQHEQVLPYILGELKQHIEKITPVKKIYLFGSRGRTPTDEWKSLEGKDWDIYIVTAFPIVNTRIWTHEKNYHIDLMINTEEKGKKFLNNYTSCVELFPNNKLNIKDFEKESFLNCLLYLNIFVH